MTHDYSANASVSRKEDATLVVAESKSFVAFNEWMDDQLAHLVAQWIHTAAPNANRLASIQKRFGR
ncbi:MAG: hypothetical protein HY288_17705 [Planctomycetia bacterium]|nr:hypothetical protein [Planctomycetia bacterium]